jgi:hypothetical protein
MKRIKKNFKGWGSILFGHIKKIKDELKVELDNPFIRNGASRPPQELDNLEQLEELMDLLMRLREKLILGLGCIIFMSMKKYVGPKDYMFSCVHIFTFNEHYMYF